MSLLIASIVIISILLVIIIISFVIFYNNKSTEKDDTDEIEPPDIKPMPQQQQCIKETVTVENPNEMLNYFIDNYSEKYLYNPENTGAALVLSAYDQEAEKVIKFLPYKMYQKILKSKITTDDISVFIGQVVVSAGKIETAYGTKNPFKPLQIYHSAFFFVETTKYKANNNMVLPEDILFTIELWAPGQGFGAASCLYPVLNGKSVDILQQDVSKIIIEYPEAFGCASDGAYWDGHWDEIFYLGDTTVSVVEQFYDLSFDWLSSNWGYTAVSLVSSSCVEDEQLPNKAVLGNTCESFIQAMCLKLQKIDKSFTNLLPNLPFNDIELIGKWEKLNLQSQEVVDAINGYNATIKLILEKASETVESFDDNDQIILPKYIRKFLKKKLVNSDFTLGEDGPENKGKQSDLSNKVNLLISSVLFPALIKKLSEIGMVDQNNRPVLIVTIFNKNAFDVYKITLETPYLQSIYSTCPSMLYEKIHT